MGVWLEGAKERLVASALVRVRISECLQVWGKSCARDCACARVCVCVRRGACVVVDEKDREIRRPTWTMAISGDGGSGGKENKRGRVESREGGGIREGRSRGEGWGGEGRREEML